MEKHRKMYLNQDSKISQPPESKHIKHSDNLDYKININNFFYKP